MAKNLNLGANSKVATKAQNVLLDLIKTLSDANWSVVGVMGAVITINLGPHVTISNDGASLIGLLDIFDCNDSIIRIITGTLKQIQLNKELMGSMAIMMYLKEQDVTPRNQTSRYINLILCFIQCSTIDKLLKKLSKTTKATKTHRSKQIKRAQQEQLDLIVLDMDVTETDPLKLCQRIEEATNGSMKGVVKLFDQPLVCFFNKIFCCLNIFILNLIFYLFIHFFVWNWFIQALNALSLLSG